MNRYDSIESLKVLSLVGMIATGLILVFLALGLAGIDYQFVYIYPLFGVTLVAFACCLSAFSVSTLQSFERKEQKL